MVRVFPPRAESSLILPHTYGPRPTPLPAPETGPSRGLEDVLRRLLGHLGRGRLELKLLGTAQLPAERAAVLLSLHPEGRCNYATMYRVYCYNAGWVYTV